MVAHDELGGLLPIKRTIRVIDSQNQSFREQEVRRRGARRVGSVFLGRVWGFFLKVDTVHLGGWQGLFLIKAAVCFSNQKKKGSVGFGFPFFCFTRFGSVVISMLRCYADEVNCISSRLSAGRKSSTDIGCPGLGFLLRLWGSRKKAAERRQPGGSELPD